MRTPRTWPGPSALRRAAKYAAAIVVIGVGSSLFLRAAHVGLPLWYAMLSAAAAIFLLQLGRWLWNAGYFSDVPGHGADPRPLREVIVLAPIERSLGNASRDRRSYASRLRPMLYDIARERVLHHGGPDLGELDQLDRSPHARDTLGEELLGWLSDRREDGPPPSPQRLQWLVTEIAQL